MINFLIKIKKHKTNKRYYKHLKVENISTKLFYKILKVCD